MQSVAKICPNVLWIYAKSWTRSKAGDEKLPQLLNLTCKVYFPVDFVIQSLMPATELLTVVVVYCPDSLKPTWASSPLPMLLRPPGRLQMVVPFGQHCLLVTLDLQFWSQRPRISWCCWIMPAYSTHFHWLTPSCVYLTLCFSQKYIALVFFP